MIDDRAPLLLRDHCRKCRKPVGPLHRYDILAVQEDDGWVFCDACKVLEEQAHRQYLASLSWWQRVVLWWRTH